MLCLLHYASSTNAQTQEQLVAAKAVEAAERQEAEAAALLDPQRAGNVVMLGTAVAGIAARDQQVWTGGMGRCLPRWRGQSTHGTSCPGEESLGEL